MFRLWGKLVKDDSIINEHTFELNTLGLSIEEKLLQGLKALCYQLDIQIPMWLSGNNSDISLIRKTSFINHHFVEEIDFDYFEIEIIEDL